MNPYEIISQLTKAGFDIARLRQTGKIDKFINAIAAEFQAKDSIITGLQTQLSVRRRRQVQRQTVPSVATRGKGRPRKYPLSWDYFEYWWSHPARNFGTSWLNNVKTNHIGKPLTRFERRHIEKILTELTPDYLHHAVKDEGYEFFHGREHLVNQLPPGYSPQREISLADDDYDGS